MALLVLAAGFTIYSQFSIIPAMERDRINAGGAIDAADAANPSRMDFEKLHRRSENVEGAILLLDWRRWSSLQGRNGKSLGSSCRFRLSVSHPFRKESEKDEARPRSRWRTQIKHSKR